MPSHNPLGDHPNADGFGCHATAEDGTLDVTADPAQRRAYVTSGLPVSVASNVYRDREEFCQSAQAISDADRVREALCYTELVFS